MPHVDEAGVRMQLPSLPQALGRSHVLSPISAAVLARRQNATLSRTASLPSLALPLPRHLPVQKQDMHHGVNAAQRGGALWDKLDSDPVDSEDVKLHFTTPTRKQTIIKMEDYLGSARSSAPLTGMPAASLATRAPPAPILARANTAPQLPQVHARAAPPTKPTAVDFASILNATATAPAIGMKTKVEARQPKKKRTYSYANSHSHFLHRSVSLDRFLNNNNHKNNNKEDLSHSYSLGPLRPILPRAHSYQDASDAKKLRLDPRGAALTHRTSETEFLDTASTWADEPDLTFSTDAGDADTTTTSGVPACCGGDSDDCASSEGVSSGGEEGETSSESEAESLCSATYSSSSTLYRAVHTERSQEKPAIADELASKKALLSQIERDCAAVLLGMGCPN